MSTRAAGVYIMIVEDQVYLFTDATVNIDPTAEDLAEIACLAADFAAAPGDRAARGLPLLLELWLHPAPALGQGPQGRCS